ncbi:PP2C family protein-serine/threonine phosphatase [Geodermatophilus obscurus]|uniref:Protein serine phosphatase with GAF(S) sensor(S) n=1 Tax=Geodermatophilus obscurus (strain ATCC 25078 / DSM 43160 / JCM 3152 / CCUG 61914 / KCC A-0152 / KCTC 9177 / NBRC 13315 / NRRL B-3577 / G-20) TaxID=526225 RepID=D2SGS9_GEOOG|nr:GAF domain-containing SpoIIE family protein phosphatase [Geodermatophilus obscurus]ADB74922.1 protein serine phosphatase with GAF(s) sensor(s) [Geodermatophilus obscurus DSM 43160]
MPAVLVPEGRAADPQRPAVAVFDGNWTLVSVDQATADLLGRRREELAGRNIWIALPELAGTIFHSFLLHARSVGDRVTWRGFYPPASCWLDATAHRVGDRLHVTLRPSAGPAPEGVSDLPAGAAEDDRLRFLAEVSESMVSTLDPGESMATLVDLVVPRLCDWALVSVLGDDGDPAGEGWAHRDPALAGDLDLYLSRRVRAADDDNPLVKALLTGEPIHLPVIDPAMVEPAIGGDEEVRAAWERLDAGSITVVPLRARAETFGVLGLVNGSARPPHSEMEIATAVEVARRASLAIDNARLYGRQLAVAETLQRSLLTPPPQPDDLEIAVRYLPASSTLHVGGDWYDAFQQPDGATLLVIGDVVGHNVDAAAAMGQVRSILRGIAYDRQEEPARVLTRVDAALTGLRIGTLATALIARIEQPGELAGSGRRVLRWSSAGHLPPLLLRGNGRVELLASEPQTLLGAESTRPRTDAVAEVGPGDTLLFYTDGLVEQGRTGIDEGTDRLVAAVRELAAVPVHRLCDALIERIVGRRPEDDVAIVAVRCSAQGGGPAG